MVMGPVVRAEVSLMLQTENGAALRTQELGPSVERTSEKSSATGTWGCRPRVADTQMIDGYRTHGSPRGTT